MKQIENPKKILKQGIWLYLILLLFEGGLRKWVFPTIAGPLVLIRDPLVVALLFLAFKRGFLKVNLYLIATVFFSIAAIGTTFIFGHGNINVCLFGARLTLLYFPLIFVIGNIFNRSDVLQMGEILLYISIPMTILMILQFYSPQSAWVNRGLGGDIEGAGFSGALGFFRPPGTFSFISGLTQFYGLTTGFIFYFWMKPNSINRIVLIAATIGLISAIPFSISRTLFYQTVIALLFMIFGIAQKAENIPKIVFGAVAFVVVLFSFTASGFLTAPVEAFTTRFAGATKFEGGVSGTLLNRYVGGMIDAFSGDSTTIFFGKGLGSGTNAGAQILPIRQGGMVWQEDEWPRMISESGLFIGLAFIFLRVSLSIHLAICSYKQLIKNDIFPWLLLSFCLVLIPNGQWGQPTTLGFSAFAAGILISSLKNSAD